MTTRQTVFTQEELLAGHDIAEPLVAGGVRCHGGFDEDGNYVSPRTKNRVPAIAAWQEQRTEQFGTPLLDVPLDTWPEHYPSVAHARFLLEHGVREPIVATLTRIGTVEGFGSLIRYSLIPDFQACFAEDVRGTAMDHLGRGLYEAHARDEAGFEEEAGHKQMWFAARDIAFENPVTEDQTAIMLERMGISRAAGSGSGSGGSYGGPPPMAAMREQFAANRLLPDDIDLDLEILIERMVRLLLIEISAFHTFAWAETLLSDTDLVAGDGEAARLVSYIRSDESPHVAYLETVLSEMRDRTFVGESGRTYPGTEMIGRLWERAVRESLGVRREATIKITQGEIRHALDGRPDGADLLAEFEAIGAPTQVTS